jgi:mannitol/fructose-specific phosphotransferase system IIA component (Ntr-type)
MPRPLLSPAAVLLQIHAPDRTDLIRRMAASLHALATEQLDASCSVDDILAALAIRESEASTALGEGFACPHVRLPGLPRMTVVVATMASPLDWGNGRQINWVALLATPQEQPAAALRVMGKLAKIALDPVGQQFLAEARDPDVVHRWLQSRLAHDEAPLTAGEIMRGVMGTIGPDMPVPELTRRMVGYNLDCAGITDEGNRLIGLVTADALFTLGMPDFFHQLKSVSFIANFDPFEKYFADESKLVARDVMTTELAAVAPSATILEIVHLLSVQNFSKVFVVDSDNRLLGVIDRIRVVDRLLNL